MKSTMEQTQIDDETKWKMKDLRSARQTSVNVSADLISSMINMGILKPKDTDELFEILKRFADRVVGYIWQGMEIPLHGASARVHVEITDGKQKTIDHKEELRNLGFHWDATKKVWVGDFDQDYFEKKIHKNELLKNFRVVWE